MMTKILLVEDDPTTRAFLAAAVAGLPADVDAADCCAAALALASHHDLLLIDANLPDGDGAGLLAALRARGLQAPALAHTAAQERGTLDALRDAGFVDVLVKPMPAATLQAAIRDALGVRGLRVADAEDGGIDGGDAAIWDDATALAALNGQQAHVDALRALFVGELPDTRDRVRAAASARDVDALRASLHRLRASCGFVGASRLAAAVNGLRATPHSAEALARFLDAAQDTLSSA